VKPGFGKRERYSGHLWRWRMFTSGLRLLPDFIIIGAQRGGTTSLYSYLVQHPHIAPAATKETQFFSVQFTRGMAWYRAHFASSLYRSYTRQAHKHDLITGEASPYYIFHPQVSARIAERLPQVKLIALLRNPVDRAYSHYWHVVQLGHEPLSFEEAVRHEPIRLEGERERLLQDARYHSVAYRRYSYLARGIYVDQLETWTHVFPREQILILCSEELYADPATGLGQTLAFLGLPGHEITEYRRHNHADYSPMNPATRTWLIDYFQPYNERLYEYLGKRFPWV
jgi:hypothetical protein